MPLDGAKSILHTFYQCLPPFLENLSSVPSPAPEKCRAKFAKIAFFGVNLLTSFLHTPFDGKDFLQFV